MSGKDVNRAGRGFVVDGMYIPCSTLHRVAQRRSSLHPRASVDRQRASERAQGVYSWCVLCNYGCTVTNARTMRRWAVEGLLMGSLPQCSSRGVGVTGTGIAVALRAAGVGRAFDVPSDLLGPVTGYNNNNLDSGPGAERMRRRWWGDQRLTYPGQQTTATGSA